MEKWFQLSDRVIRPLLALMFGSAFIYLTIMGSDPPAAFSAVATAVILWYFKARDDEKASIRLEEKQREVVDLARALPPSAN